MSGSARISPTNLTPNDEYELDHISLGGRRPGSAESRNAWDNEAFDNTPGVTNTISTNYYDYDDRPAEMSSEVYVSTAGSHRHHDQDENEFRERKGIWTSVKKGLRGLWGTRQTEDTQKDRELYIRTTIRELIVYIFFLITLCILTFGMTSSTHFYYTKVMQELFIDGQFPETKNTFRGMNTMHDFWRFAEGPLMDGLFWETWYNNQNVSNEDLGYIYYENKLLGVARIRQLKVRKGSCEVHPDFAQEITACYDSYSKEKEDISPFGLENGTAWSYHQQIGQPYTGYISSYSTNGYYQDLLDTKASSLNLIEILKQNLWLDRGTRAVFVDFTVYNANINLFCVVRLVVEFPATGGAVPSWQFRTVKLIRYVTNYDYFLMACEVLYMLFILYYIVEEILEIKKHKCAYFKSVWNCLDILVIFLSLIAFAFNIYRTVKVNSLLETLLQNPRTYPDFEFLGFWQMQYNNMVAVVVFFAWIKIFKYISFNRTMTQLQSTLSRCSKDIAGFAVMFFIIFLAYAQLGYLVFGTQVEDFSTFPESIFTQFRIILGDFDFHELESANRVLGPIFFLTYVFFVFFVLLNMFLAIINDTYSEVKAEISMQKSEFQISDYIKKGYNKVLEKLSLKKDRIRDIQDAIHHADINHDRHLDWEEWRLDLKMRGIPDAEIEAVFAKYDQDGDMILNEDEQRKMHADLEKQKNELDGQKADLTNELDEIERDKNASIGRPPSARSKGAVSHVSCNDSANESDEDDDYDEERRANLKNVVSKDDFQILTRRVDRMEHSIGSIVSKIDAVIVKLEAMERAKLKRRETMGKLLDNITEDERNGRSDDEIHRDQMERLVREELERWDSDASITSSAHRSHRPLSGRSVTSSTSGSASGVRSRIAGATGTSSNA
ncbi:polycystin-2-like protein 1 isoform X2 [Clavelina lepadiformis]|uniref:polycystin-2-like protein 1 isoform X2 n=1 Tax=Clavelina lepadiformis TaxID=159417 RepID=UPI004041A2D4